MNRLNGKTARLKEEVTLVSIEDNGVLLDVSRRCYYDLNDTAAFLLKLMEQNQDAESLLGQVLAEFNVAEETARRDIADFTAELVTKDLLNTGDGNIDRGRAARVKRGVKPYRSPVLAYQKELIVADATPTPTRP